MGDFKSTTVRGNLRVAGTLSAERVEVNIPALTATLSTTWTTDSTNGCVYQDVTVVGILYTDSPVVALNPSVNATTASTQESEWGKIYKATVTARNTIRFYAKSATTTSISVLIRR